jgi:hypothetical protein
MISIYKKILNEIKENKWSILSFVFVSPIIILLISGSFGFIDGVSNYYNHYNDKLPWICKVLAILCFPLALVISLKFFYRFNLRYKFSNYEVKRIGILYDEKIDGLVISDSNPFLINDNFVIRIILYFFTLIISYNINYNSQNFVFGDLYNYLVSFLICGIYLMVNLRIRKEAILAFPTNELYNQKLILISNYLDYQNKNIENDDPCISNHQAFSIQVKELPRNSFEENQVLILNPKTPKKSAIVTIIEDKNLADIVRKGESELKAQLVSIQEHTKLEIALWLEKK